MLRAKGGVLAGAVPGKCPSRGTGISRVEPCLDKLINHTSWAFCTTRNGRKTAHKKLKQQNVLPDSYHPEKPALRMQSFETNPERKRHSAFTFANSVLWE